MDATDRVGRAGVGVCPADLLVLQLADLALHGGYILCVVWLLALLNEGSRLLVVANIIIIILVARFLRRRWRALAPPSPAAPGPRSARAPGPPCGVLVLGKTEVDDVGVREAGAVEAEADFALLEGCVEEGLLGWG